MNKTMIGVCGLTLLLGAGLAYWWFGASDSESEGREPLYWAAPMNPDYRRDEPGQSPMGMDLVPVYEEDQAPPGVVEVSPRVMNSMGVRTTSVAPGRLQSTLRTVGYVGFNENSIVHMHPRVEGWVEKLAVNSEGEQVQAGQLVYTLYSPALVSAQEEYLLALQSDNDRLLASTRARLKALRVPDSLLTAIREQRRVFQTVDYYAPKAGVVAMLGAREGNFVKPGGVLMSIASLDEVWVEAEIFEGRAARVAEGNKVTLRVGALPGRQWQGELDYLYPVLDAQSRTLRARIHVDNPDHALKPNMFAQLRIETAPGPERLIVPNDAIISTGDQDRVVLVVGEGRFKSVSVEVGERGADNSVVLDGLEAGDEIVSAAQFLIDSESSVDSDFQRMEDGEGSSSRPGANQGENDGMEN